MTVDFLSMKCYQLVQNNDTVYCKFSQSNAYLYCILIASESQGMKASVINSMLLKAIGFFNHLHFYPYFFIFIHLFI